MARYVDLNADMGESFGDWTMGNDAALLDVVTSANVACGFHAGDADVMANTMALAAAKGVGIGAHPGFADLQGFGRRRMSVAPDTLQNLIRYQVSAALGMARVAGGTLTHFKLHGALSNMASEDIAMARICFEAALDVAPDMTLMVLSQTPLQHAAEGLGAKWAGEIFADRSYNDDASLVARGTEGAVIHDPAEAAMRIVEMVQEGAIITATGRHIPAQIDTICVHGDTPEALDIARAVRTGLEGAGVRLRGLAS